MISTIDLARMIEVHRRHNALATLAVQERQASRYLLFDRELQLCGRGHDGTDDVVRSADGVRPLAFSGIHVISPCLLPMIAEEGTFSIWQPYLRLAGQGKRIVGYRAEGCYWRDLGKPESIAHAAEEFAQGRFSSSDPPSG